MSISNKTLDQLAENIAAGIQMLGGIKQGAEAQIREIVEEALRKFDVVTDERMQVQEAMLAKARAQLAELEKRVVALEKRVKQQER
ncbi:MAG: accessory factor UbiK family protein [Zetaproteobacteria bacterium]|nr:MAG: accessory factor UbiK family protein [Zetaproteobacteria bacterium]